MQTKSLRHNALRSSQLSKSLALNHGHSKARCSGQRLFVPIEESPFAVGLNH